MEKEKKIGTTMKERCGDWVTTFECIGYVNGHNVWQEKKRQYSPQPNYAEALRTIELDRAYQRTKNLHRKISAV